MKLTPAFKRLSLALCLAWTAMALLTAAITASAQPRAVVAPASGSDAALWERVWDRLATRVNTALTEAPAETVTAASAPEVPSPERQVQNAWQASQRAGAYRFATRLVQTTHPAPEIANVGQGSRVERAYIEGETDLSAQTLLLRLWPDGNETSKAGNNIELRIEGDRAYGRSGTGEWQEIDNVTDAFAPANDLLAYLAGVKNVKLEDAASRLTPHVSRFTFDLDGPAFADSIRNRLEEQLRAKGELPPGIYLDTPDPLRRATGNGEVWIDDDGLPLRLAMHIQYPPQANGEQVEADIQTDFSGFPRATAAQAEPQEPAVGSTALAKAFGRLSGAIAAWIRFPAGRWEAAVLPASLGTALLGLMAAMVLHRRSKKVYAAVILSIIFTMIVAPLLQGQQAYAWSQKQAARQAASEQRQKQQDAERQYQDIVSGANYNPHRDPLASTDRDQASGISDQASGVRDQAAADRKSAIKNPKSVIPEATPDPAGDEDGDGLTYLQESRLGTSPNDEDTDGDQITDNAEVAGFLYNGRMWYSDPLNPDSNGDGQVDAVECPEQMRPDPDNLSPAGAICTDIDGDGAPDIFDRDNDDDGVPDAVDTSPYDKVARDDGSPFDGDNPLLLQVDALQPGVPAFVDFQLRPVNADHLWHALNVLDWPSGDEVAQIQRKTGNDSTFADVAATGQPVADNTRNGDMRLIPMLEIEMTGDSIPLALTTPAKDVAVSGEVTGTVHMQQQGSDVRLDFDLETAGVYTVKIYDGGCPASGTALYTLGDIGDGASYAISDQQLVSLADGEHTITFSGSHEACAAIANIINGPYTDRMIDLAALEPYGVSVQEKNEAGTLLAYVPLNMVADETAGDRVAFSGRMLYSPTTDQWGDTQKVRVVWLVQMLVDRCPEAPCADDEWELDQTAIVQTYYDNWRLTGLTAREDHGLDIAVIYEDPAEKPSAEARRYDDYLWMLAWGLQSSFITGRDQDGDGLRDITVAEIYNRWGDPASPASDEMRWNIPVTATGVITFAYPHQDYYTHLAMTETARILDDVFGDTVDQGSDAPTLLFAQEAHYRTINLSDESSTLEAVNSTLKITLRLDPEQIREETRTQLSWAPYRRAGDAWQSYPVKEYWDRLAVRFEDIFDEYEGDPQFEDIRRGQVFLAQSFYLGLFSGQSALVQIGGELVGSYEASQSDLDLWGVPPELAIEGATVIAVIGTVSEGLKKIQEMRASAAEIRDFLAYIGQVDKTGQWGAPHQWKLTKEKLWGTIGPKGVVTTLLVIVLYCISIELNIEPLYHILNGVFLFQTVWDLGDLLGKLAVAHQKSGSWLKAFKAEGSSALSKMGVCFLIAGIVVSWGVWGYQMGMAGTDTGSMAFTFALAHQIATTIADIILVLLAAIPVIGALLTTIVFLIDTYLYLICGLLGADPSEEWICKGFEGWLAEGVRMLIYGGGIMVTLDDEDRLRITDFDQDLLDPLLGMRIGNSLVVTGTVQNTLHLVDFDEFVYEKHNPTAAFYGGLFDAKRLRSSTFRYYLDERPNKHREELERYGIRGYEWDPENCEPPYDGCTYEETSRGQTPLTQDGINHTTDLYLTEKYAVPALECWGLAEVAVCYVRTERGDAPIDLGGSLLLDVFPATLDQFYTLAGWRGGYGLAWSLDSVPAFPRLQDADGDGLRGWVDGGADPNDSKWDTDGDGLSDFYEVQLGTRSQDMDYDNDGLSDREEVILKTNPNRADSDYDGLTDAEELAGWEFVYDFAPDGSQLRTWVTSDPLTLDGDDDTLTDFQEKTYGFNPRVASDPHILTFASDVDASRSGRADLTVAPGDVLDYQASVKNELFNRYAQGLLSVDFPAAFTEPAPETFVLNPQEAVTLTGEVSVDPAAASGAYSLTQEADALITDWREASSYADMLLHLDDASGTTVFADSSGAQPPRDGACDAGAGQCPTAGEAGLYGYALRFDGVNDVVTVGNANIDDPQALTIAAWVKPDALPEQVMRFVTLEGEKAVLRYDGSVAGGAGQLHFYMTIGGSLRHVRVNDTLTAGEWQFVAGTYDGSVMRLYRNGVEVGSLAVSSEVSGGDGLHLGSTASGEAFAGLMDEVALFPRALTGQEITALYGRPIFHMPFDEDSGATRFRDDSGFGNDGTCTGASCPAAAAGGVIGTAIQLDGADTVAVPASSLLDVGGSDFTLAAWIAPEADPPASSCPWRAEYYHYEYDIHDQTYMTDPFDDWPPVVTRCDAQPDFDWGTGSSPSHDSDDFGVRWVGTLAFKGGLYTLHVVADDGFQLYIDGYDWWVKEWWEDQHDRTFQVSLSSGLHTIKFEYFEQTGSAKAKLEISPTPAPHAQGILGSADTPALQRVGNRLRVTLNTSEGKKAFTTSNDVLTSGTWNHVATTFEDASGTLTLWVDGLPVQEFHATGVTSGQAFDIGRGTNQGQVGVSRLDTQSFNTVNLVMQYREGNGNWEDLWSQANPSPYTRYPIDVQKAFTDRAEIRLLSDYGDFGASVIGSVTLRARDPSAYEAAHTFQNQVNLFWDERSDSVPFRGRIDEVALYPRTLAADDVRGLYEAGALVLRLPLDDPPGATTFADVLGQHNGACAGASCPTAGVPGRQELALLFDGADDTVEVNDANTADLQKLTVAAWARLDSLSGGAMRLVTVGDDKAALRYQGNDLDFSLKTVDGGTHRLQAGAALQPDVWHHLAGTYDGQAMRFYLDGTEVATQTLTGTLAAGQTVRLSSTAEPLDGALDEVAIYRRALSAIQVEALYGSAPELLLLLDETAGATAYADATGNGHDGACAGDRCPAAGAKGQIGLAVQFDGANDAIEVPHSDRLNPEGELTLAAWIKPTNATVTQKLIGKSGGSDGYVLGIQDGKLSAEVWDANGTRYAAAWGGIAAGAWTHLALTWASGGALVGYINGNEVGRLTASANGIRPNPNPLWVGIAPSTGGVTPPLQPANGRLDHVTLFTRALASSEVRAMYRLQAKWVEERQSASIKVDADAPGSSLVSNGAYWPNRDAVLLVTAQDPTTFVTGVELGVSTDGGQSYVWEDAPACQDAASGAAWCPTLEPAAGEGRYLLQTRATDKMGHRETPAQTATFLVDAAPPQPATAIAEGQILRPQRVGGAEPAWLISLSGTANDPAVAGSPGSGAASVLAKLTDTGTVTDTLLPQAAAVAGAAWQTDYRLQAADPTGTYRISAQATDLVGNTSGFTDLVTVGVDAAPPEASLDPLPGPYSTTITSTVQLTGRITETGAISSGVAGLRVSILPAAMASMSNTLAILHFEEPAGATSFADDAGGGAATCTAGGCPAAAADGIWGAAADFTTDDCLAADFVAGRFNEAQGLSFGAWVYPEYHDTYDYAVLAFDAANGEDRNRLIRRGSLFCYADAQTGDQCGSTHIFDDDRWYYVMATITADGEGTLFVNGQPEKTFQAAVRPDPAGRFNIGSEWDGATLGEFFEGRMDEVVIYNRALSRKEVGSVYADAALAASGQGVLSTGWQYAVPEGLEGLYQLNVRPYDVFGNAARRADWPAWRGEIDTAAPEVKLTIAERKETYDVAGLQAFLIKTTYTCWARDFNLVAASTAHPEYDFQCPCNTLAPLATTITDTFYHQVSPWYAEVFTDTTRLYERAAACTVTGPAADNFMQACDAYGHCASQVADVDQAFEMIPAAYTVVLTPMHQAILTAIGATNIQSRAYARDRIKLVEVYDSGFRVGATPIDASCNGNITTTEWSQAWIATEGSHSLTSKIISCDGSETWSVSNLVWVDSLPPLPPTVWPLMLNRQQRLSYGRVALTGQASDAPPGAGINRLEVSVDAGPWAEASLDGSDWRYEWNLGAEPDNAQHNVAVRATDFAGWSTQAAYGVTVDLDSPHPVTLTLTSDVTGGGIVRAGATLRQLPAQLNLAWQASEPVTKLLSYQALWAVETATQTLQIPAVVPPAGPLASSYPALFDAQRVEPSVTSVFFDGNTQVDDWGPIYVDTPFTPDFISMDAVGAGSPRPYHGWMDSGCSAIGLDRRMAEAVPDGISLNSPQNFYVTWDSEALRLAWTGANWDYNGDLFIYMDTLGDPTVPITAFNPFSATEGVTLNIPGAKAFIWVQDSSFADLRYWDGASFQRTVLNASQYRFDAGLRGGATDLYIPFDLLGITNPAITPLVLYAFATDEGALRLWSTMPPQNSLNSPDAVETALYAGANQVLQWLHVYTWPSLGPGICPNNPTGLLPLYTDQDIRFEIAADPVGASYGLMSSDLFWLAETLTDPNRPVTLSQTFAFMDVDHPPLGDGDTVNYTVSYENHGAQTATGVTLQAVGLCALNLVGAVNGTLTVTVGDISPGAAGSVTFSGQVDTAGQSGLCQEWAAVQAVVHDNAYGAFGNPLDWLWTDHQVDIEPPGDLSITWPEALIGTGDNLFSGTARDASGVPLVTMEAQAPPGGVVQTACPDDTPADGLWSCAWNATAANGGAVPADGDQFLLRLQATDGRGLISDWTGWQTFTVDAVPPTVTFSAETTETYSNTAVGGTRLSFTGQTHDNRAIGQVEVCLDADCRWASVQAEGDQDGYWTRAVSGLEGQDNVLHTVSVHAVDLVGNQSEGRMKDEGGRRKGNQSASLAFHLDNVAPVITVTAAITRMEALPDRLPTTVLSGTVADGSEVDAMVALVRDPAGNLQSQAVGRGEDGTWWYDLPAGGAGLYAIWIRAEDAADNETALGPYDLRLTCRSTDLTAELVGARTAIGAGSPISLTASVRNSGGDTVPAGLPVSFYVDDLLIEAATTTRALAAGESEELTVAWDVAGAGDAEITIAINDDGTGAGTVALCAAPAAARQTLSILDVPLGQRWNLVSSYVTPLDTNVAVVQQPISGAYDVIQSYDNGPAGPRWRSYYPAPEEPDTLSDLDAGHGYWIRAHEGISPTLRIAGTKLAEDAALELAAGWNLVSYLPRTSLPVTEALAGIEGGYLAVHGFDRGAMSFYPDLDPGFNTLTVLEPQHGYWIQATSAVTLAYSQPLGGAVDFTGDPAGPGAGVRSSDRFQGAEGAASGKAAQPLRPEDDEEVSPTNQWITLYSANAVFQGAPAPAGAVVRVFSQGVQCGSFVVTASGRYGVMPCYRDDPNTPAVDEGAEPGDSLTFTINDVSSIIEARSVNGVPVDANTPITWSQNLDRWEVNIYVSPLAVDLAFFTAQAEEEAVRLTWETISEIAHQGFNLYRGPAASGPWRQLNAGLIASPAPGSTAGQHYEWLDTDVLDGQVYWYQLEAVDIQGGTRIAGEARVEMVPAPPAPKIWLPLVLAG